MRPSVLRDAPPGLPMTPELDVFQPRILTISRQKRCRSFKAFAACGRGAYQKRVDAMSGNGDNFGACYGSQQSTAPISKMAVSGHAAGGRGLDAKTGGIQIMVGMALLRIFRFTAVGMALFALAGCVTQPIRNVTNAPVEASKKDPTLDEVRDAIKRAGAGLGWVMREKSPGKMTGTLNLRTHSAVVNIPYSTKSYDIVYADSTELKYDEKKQTIHRNYNGWIQNLDRAIRTNLGNL